MRDPSRIRTILLVLGEYWRATPDLRLGQLLLDAVKPASPCPELYYIEDEKLLLKLQNKTDWTPVIPTVNHMYNDIRTFLGNGTATFRVGYSGVSIELRRETEDLHLVYIKGITQETLELLKKYIRDFDKFLNDRCTVEKTPCSSAWGNESYTIKFRSSFGKETAMIAYDICIVTDQSDEKFR